MIVDLKVTKTTLNFLRLEIWRRRDNNTASPELLSITLHDWVDGFKVCDKNLAILNDYLRQSLCETQEGVGGWEVMEVSDI